MSRHEYRVGDVCYVDLQPFPGPMRKVTVTRVTKTLVRVSDGRAFNKRDVGSDGALRRSRPDITVHLYPADHPRAPKEK